ncbi:MAG: porin [Pirellulaceae bacterium]|jgi:porin
MNDQAFVNCNFNYKWSNVVNKFGRKQFSTVALLLSFALVWAGKAICSAECRCDETFCCDEAGAQPTLPDYGGCLCCRSYLSGDWFGHRTRMATNGVTFQGDVTQYYQGVTSGGLDQNFEYGGHADYVVNMDLNKLGGWEGLFLKLRGESQFGRFINRSTGAILAANNEGLIPTAGGQDTALTNFLFTQFLSERTAVFAGKLDTMDGDMNAFAHGRGKNQFMNTALAINPLALRTVPYSTYGAGFLLLEGTEPIFSFMAIDPVDHATEGPTDLFSEGVTLASELRLPTCFLGQPGHQLIGGTWSSREVPDLSRLIVPPGLPIQTGSGSWSLYWNFDQHLYTDPCDSSRGWGIFGRAGVADDLTNPLSSFLSFGIGGNSPIRCRAADTFGVGWFYAPVSDELPGVVLSDHGQGVELFYNYAATPWLHITPDLQIIDPARRGVDTSLVFGIRVKMDL